MPTLSQLVTNRARLEIPLADGAEPLWIVYKPGAITPRTRAASQVVSGQDFDSLSEEEQEAIFSGTTALLASSVLAWNLTDNGGAPIVPTEDGLANVDYDQQAWLLGKIMEDQRQGEGSAKTPTGASSSRSSKGSNPPRPASPRSRPNGARTKR